MQSVLRCLHQLPHLGEFERWLCAATILPRVQPMLVAPNIRVPLLCVSPAFQDFAHGRDNPPACAVALQDAQRMCQLNIAHAQHVRLPTRGNAEALSMRLRRRDTLRSLRSDMVTDMLVIPPAHTCGGECHTCLCALLWQTALEFAQVRQLV